MRQIVIFFGLSLISTTAFSQTQVSNERKSTTTPESTSVNESQEMVLDSAAISTIKKPVNIENSTTPLFSGTGSNEKQQVPVLNSTKRKPE